LQYYFEEPNLSVQKIPEKGSILFVWFNQYSGILLKTPSKTVVIDPVEIKPKHLQNVDAILITHEHYDHFDPRLIDEIQKASNCQVIADLASYKRLQHLIPSEKLMGVSVGQELKLGEVKIRAEKSQHNAASPVTYIVTSEDDVKVFHTSDSLPYPELAVLGQKEKFDVVFCSVGISPASSAESGLEVARLTKAQVAIPYHTSTVASQTAFQKLVRKELPKTACLVPEQNKIYQVSRK
jgi:L-ascorbate metabolism protein UlaG (beta-lactamase superfamily)